MEPGNGGAEDNALFAHQKQDLLVDKLARVEREHPRLDAGAYTLPRMSMRMDGFAVLASFRHRRNDFVGAEILGLRGRKPRASNAAC